MSCEATLTVEVGANLAYVGIHQLGGDIDMPARQFTECFKTEAGRKLFAERGAKGAAERTVNIGKHDHHAGPAIPRRQPGGRSRDPGHHLGMGCRTLGSLS